MKKIALIFAVLFFVSVSAFARSTKEEFAVGVGCAFKCANQVAQHSQITKKQVYNQSIYAQAVLEAALALGKDKEFSRNMDLFVREHEYLMNELFTEKNDNYSYQKTITSLEVLYENWLVIASHDKALASLLKITIHHDYWVEHEYRVFSLSDFVNEIVELSHRLGVNYQFKVGGESSLF